MPAAPAGISEAASPREAPPVGPAEVERYRDRVRQTLASFGAEAAEDWERSGRLPAAVLAGLGAEGAFRERWRPGAEPGVDHLVALIEETCWFSGSLSLAVTAHSEVFIGALTLLAATRRHRALLETALAGAAIGCFAATEAQGGSDLTGIRTTIEPRGKRWRLRGRKRYVSNAGLATHVLLLARAGTAPDARDVALVLVPVDTPGVQMEGALPAVGSRACPPGEFSFDAVLPADAVLAPAGLGLAYAVRLLQFERIAICVQLTTAARIALGLATAFARRRPVGAARLMDKQVIRHRLAEARAELWTVQSQLRELVRSTAAGTLPTHELAGLKLVATRVCERVVGDCMQVMGARGYTSNYPLERLWRDVRLARVGGGTDEVMAELVGSRLDRPDDRFDALLDYYEERDLPQGQW
jgi:alkylation response protein AidB-like acyl-CoA dehydrogenase